MTIKDKLRASLNLHDLGVCILTGEDALDAFDENRDAQLAEIMRRQNAEAFIKIDALFHWLKRINEGDLT